MSPKKILLVLTICLSARNAPAQQADSAITADATRIVTGFLAAYNSRDTAQVRSYVLRGAQVTFPSGRVVPIDVFVKTIARAPSRYEDRVRSVRVTIEGDTVVAASAYQGIKDGKPVHCGVDGYRLLRVQGLLKIVAIRAGKTAPC
ncbi:MAG: nuclear transport factor 2 family protein [Gemmatimonadota bacterium]